MKVIKYLVIMLLVNCHFLAVKGQTNDIDSLRSQLENHTKKDTIRVNLLNKIAYILYTKDTDKTLILAEEASSLAEKLNFTKGEAKSLRIIGIYYNMKANYPLSLEYHQKSLKIYEKLDDKKGISDCLNSLGIVYNDQGSYPQALEYYKRAIKIFEEIDDQISISYCLNNIGVIHYDQGEYSIALGYYQKSLKIDAHVDNKDGTAIGLNNIGEIHSELGDYNLALKHYQEALKIYEEIGDTYGISYVYNDFGVVFMKTKKYPKALTHTLKSLKIAKEMGFLDIQKSTYLQLSNIYKKTKDYKKAFENFVLYKEITDSLFSEEKIKKITGLEYQYKYEKEKHTTELAQQKKDLIKAEAEKRQKIIRNSFIIGFVLMFILVLVVLRSFIHKREANSILALQKEEIHTQNEELENHRSHLEELVKKRTNALELALKKAEESDKLKSSFLANMSHEIRTPLNSILGFSSLIGDPSLDEKQTIELLYQIDHNGEILLQLIEDVLDIAKIEAGQLNINKKSYDINDQLNNLLNTFLEKKNRSENKDIELKLKQGSEEKEFNIFSDPLRIQQVFSNILENALKFTEKGFIEFGYKLNEKSENTEMIFYVKDTGIGLSKEEIETIFERFIKIEDNKKKMYRGAGLGLAICSNLIDLLGGKIWVESEENKGSTFFFTIPTKS